MKNFKFNQIRILVDGNTIPFELVQSDQILNLLFSYAPNSALGIFYVVQKQLL